MNTTRWTLCALLCAAVAAASYLLLRDRAAEPPGGESADHAAADAVRMATEAPSGARQDDEGQGGAPAEPDCGIVLASPGSHRNLALAERQLHVGGFFRALAAAGRSRLERGVVAELAGLGHGAAVPRGAPLADGGDLALPAGVSYRHPEHERRRLTSAERNRVAEVLDGGDLAAFLERAAADSSRILEADVADRALLGDRRSASVLGLLIERRGGDLHGLLPNLPPLPVGVHELAVAVEEDLPGDAFLALLDMAGGDPGAAWRDRDPFLEVNLAWVAAVNARPAALRALLARGVEPTAGGRPVLDEAALAAAGSAAFADIAEQLLATGALPRFPSTVAALRRHGVRGAAVDPAAAAALADPDLRAAGAELKALAASFDADLARAEEAERRCGAALADAGLPRGGAATLEAKLRHEEALQRRRERDMERGERLLAALDEWDVEPAAERFARLFERAAELVIMEERWDEAIAAVEGHALMDARYYGILLSLSLDHGAEFDVIALLAERSGGVLPKDAIMHLASRTWLGSADAAERLERLYGLDVHYVDDDGRNAVSKLIDRLYLPGGGFHPATTRMADFLASRSVTPKPSPAGLDPLDRVLLDLLESWSAKNVGIHHARWLVDLGAPIEASHRQLAEKLRRADADSHRRLLEAVPELAS